ncbi:hypothetical protein FHX81_7786 [Saccharothrix saharensis]|uniref:Tetratricopeptide repeat protein n=1 Tax=Saccharothrix saharensis TaxID=571190 RepID=A0A543JR77_9PSEU|nr:hypothetical protein [Saccharothrix saharensis]TQM85307.1 hypothetical protein FHX81_7786 [Saccharothrix saharensis]
MTSPENRPEVLRPIADELLARYERGARLGADEPAALAEACFRLAVHPATSSDEALSLLATAHRVDPLDPRHPYHVGLIHLRHGRLDAALSWLTAAAEAAPTNHRVWAHLSIVHQGLHERRVGDPSYEGEDRQRVDEITAAVREGEDLDGDAPSTLVRPGESRWSGIHDISAERMMRRPAGERGRDLVAQDLRRIAEFAGRRGGGAAAFTVSAVQWLVHGYPTATVRRLAAPLPDGPARRVLDLVCELFEVDEQSLPARLAECLARRELPDLLVALVHQRRLLWRPLQVSNLSAYAAARRFVAGDPAPHLDAMTSALRAVTTAAPPRTPADVTAEKVPGADPREVLAGFERDVDSIARHKKSAGDLAKALRRADLADAAVRARAHADHALLTVIAKRLEQTRVERGRELLAFKQTAVPAVRDEEFDRRVERCEKALQQPIGVNGHLSAVRKKLLSHGVPPAVPMSAGVAELAAELGAPTATPTPTPVTTPGSTDPGTRVAAAVAEVDRALADNAARAWKSFDAYPPELRRRSALVLLRSHLNGRLAEALHRMGAHTPARRHWQAMLTENPMSTAVLRNLAVAHTAAGELAEANRSWSRYLEALYAESLLAGQPARGAAERAGVHRVLAGSFGTAALCGRPADDGTPDPPPRGVAAELTSPARVALALAHLRLEELNRALSYRSPVLRLGVTRSGRRAQLDEAFDARLGLVEAACAPLPERVRAPFEELCRTAFQAAHEAACDPGSRVRGATDQDEEEAHVAWTHERVRWKSRIAAELLGSDDWPVTESSGEVLTSLRLLDQVRLDPSDDTVRKAVLRLGAPITYLRQLNDLSGLAAGFAVERIFRAAENRLDSSVDFPLRYQRLCRSWRRNGAPERHLDLLEDPHPVYLPSVEHAIDLLNDGASDREVREAVLAALPTMAHWITRLRGAPGPAAMLGELLNAVGEQDRGRSLLAEAHATCVPRDSPAYVRLCIQCDELEDARTRLLRIARKGEHLEEVHRLLVAVHRRRMLWNGALPTSTEIEEDFDLMSHLDAGDARRQLVVEVTIAKHRRRPGDVDPDSLANDLRRLLRADKGNSYARYQLTQLLYQHAVSVRTAMRATFGARREALRDELTRLRTECADHAATLLLDHDPTDDRHALADASRFEEVQRIHTKVG